MIEKVLLKRALIVVAVFFIIIMWESSAVELCSKLSEIILQTRLEVRRSLFDHFKVVLGQARDRKNNPPPLAQFT